MPHFLNGPNASADAFGACSKEVSIARLFYCIPLNEEEQERMMLGLAVVLVLIGYLLISVLIVRRVLLYARNHGKNHKRWGWTAALVLYLIPFWDWLPTVAVHQYACATEAGLWIYKTPEQWKKENPGVLESLVANDPAPSTSQGDMLNYTDTYIWNPRFNLVVKKTGPFLFNIWRHEQEVVDVTTAEIVGKRIDFSTGDGKVGGEPELRFWMHNDHCFGGQNKAINFVRIFKKFKGAEK